MASSSMSNYVQHYVWFDVRRGTSSVTTALIDANIVSKRIEVLQGVFPGIAVHTGDCSIMRRHSVQNPSSIITTSA